MKNNKLIKVVLIASLLGSNAVMAESDYPATDFQPKVLYSDSDYKHSSEAPASAADKSASKSASVESSDSNYPATNYQPKVLYSDDGYKHSSEAPRAAGSSKSSATSSAASAAVEVVQTEKAASSNFSYIGLIVLAVAGFFIYNKKAGVGKSQSSSAGSYAAADYSSDVEGSTGVEKYLNKLADVNKTGVAKYLEKQTSAPSTGVAKYMAKQIVKDREVAAARATGVEKYLRDKG